MLFQNVLNKIIKKEKKQENIIIIIIIIIINNIQILLLIMIIKDILIRLTQKGCIHLRRNFKGIPSSF